MTTESAEVIDLEISTLDLVTTHGANIASHQWSGGSWADVYEYKGRYFAVDESGMMELSSAADAFTQAGIGRDTYDKISHVSISPDYQHLIDQ
jgi:hypothetical protein